MDEIDKAINYFQENGVRCKRVEDDREEYGDTIAVFAYGNLTRKQIVDVIKEKDLTVMFFEKSIREDEYKKRRMTPQERTRAAVHATGNKWAIENFNATH